jgi:histidyl-tRNA synthetase
MINPQTLKGFRDFLPLEARKRQYVINILKKVFESYGFEPLETPALEYEEILMGKYGEEGDKLMYRFKDNGKRKVALRYDQTVPLARVVAQYQNELPMPFKRYQIQNVWRADNTQKGRYREFLQCDADIVGSNSLLSDLEVLQCVDSSMKTLGFKDFTISINSRKVFDMLGSDSNKIIKILDKEDKIGKEEMLKQLTELIGSNEETIKIYNMLKNLQPTQIPARINEIIDGCKKLNINVFPMFFLARGLDYYTDLIFEIKVTNFKSGSVGGGGRYDNLIGIFAGKQIPAVGFAFGFDRLMESMDELGLFPTDLTTTKALVTVFSKELEGKSLEVAKKLREKNINTEIYLDDAKMEKQLRYADKKQIPYVVIIGPDEARNNTITVKNLKTREQKNVPLDQLLGLFKE